MFNDLTEDEQILNKLIIEYSSNPANDLNHCGPMDIGSILNHLVYFLGAFRKFDIEYLKRKEGAIDVQLELQTMVDEMYSEIYVDRDTEIRDLTNPLVSYVYEVVKRGEFSSLKRFTSNILIKYPTGDGKIDYKINFVAMEEIARGYVYVVKIPSLETEISELQTRNSQPSPFKKLCWTGTPQEFGEIFYILFHGKYIKWDRDKITTLRRLISIFDVRDQDGSILSDFQLYSLFQEPPQNFSVVPPALKKVIRPKTS